jgi:hypothetical protein
MAHVTFGFTRYRRAMLSVMFALATLTLTQQAHAAVVPTGSTERDALDLMGLRSSASHTTDSTFPAPMGSTERDASAPMGLPSSASHIIIIGSPILPVVGGNAFTVEQ